MKVQIQQITSENSFATKIKGAYAPWAKAKSVIAEYNFFSQLYLI